MGDYGGDFTGELALFKEDVHEAYAEAMIDTNVCMIKRQDLQGYLIKYPSISLKVLSEFSKRLETSEKQTARVATETVETRIALYLAYCIDDDDEDMEDEGLIRQLPHRKIKILDLDGLLIL